MAKGESGDLCNIFLGPKSSFCGSFYNEDFDKLSLCVDFQKDITRTCSQSQVFASIFSQSGTFMLDVLNS